MRHVEIDKRDLRSELRSGLERARSVKAGAHRVAIGFQQLAETGRGVHVVIHDEDTTTRLRRLGVAGVHVTLTRGDDQRQMNCELAASTRTGAACTDLPAVQRNQRACQRQPEPQARRGLCLARVQLHEHVENPCQVRRRNTDSIVADRDDRPRPFGAHRQFDAPVGGRELCSVIQQVGDNLCEPGRITIHMELTR